MKEEKELIQLLNQNWNKDKHNYYISPIIHIRSLENSYSIVFMNYYNHIEFKIHNKYAEYNSRITVNYYNLKRFLEMNNLEIEFNKKLEEFETKLEEEILKML